MTCGAGCSGPGDADAGADNGARDDARPDDNAADATETDVAAEEGAAEVGDCSLCGTPCEGADVSCGTACCINERLYLPDGSWYVPTVLSCMSYCAQEVYFDGMMVVDFAARPDLRADPNLPRFGGYEYRGDGTELLVGGGYAEPWEAVDCINHCFPGGDYWWLIDVRDRSLVVYEAVTVGDPDYGLSIHELAGYWDTCPSPIPGDPSRPNCVFRADVPTQDETFYIGWRNPYTIKGYSMYEDAWVDRSGYLPVLPDAIPIYRTSTGERIGYANLRTADAFGR